MTPLAVFLITLSAVWVGIACLCNLYDAVFDR